MDHDISIKRVNNGFICTVGCQTLVFTDKMQMAEAFTDYMKDPDKAQRKWCDAPSGPVATGSVLPTPAPKYLQAMGGAAAQSLGSMYDNIIGRHF